MENQIRDYTEQEEYYTQDKINEIEEFLNRGNGISGTQDIIRDLTVEVLKELNFEFPY